MCHAGRDDKSQTQQVSAALVCSKLWPVNHPNSFCNFDADLNDAAAVSGAPLPDQAATPGAAPSAAEPSAEQLDRAEAFSVLPEAAKSIRLPQRRQAPPPSPYRRPGPGPVDRQVSIADLRPTKGHAYRRDFYYQAS